MVGPNPGQSWHRIAPCLLALRRVVGREGHPVRAGEEERRRLGPAQQFGEPVLGRVVAEQRRQLESLDVGQRPDAAGAGGERQRHLIVQQAGRTIAVVLHHEDRRALLERHRRAGLVGDDVLGVGGVVLGPVEVQPADVPVEIEQVLELERDVRRRSDQQQVDRDAVGGIDDRHPGPVTLDPALGGVARPHALGAVEHREEGLGLPLAMREQRLERGLHRRIGVLGEDHRPARLGQVVGVHVLDRQVRAAAADAAVVDRRIVGADAGQVVERQPGQRGAGFGLDAERERQFIGRERGDVVGRHGRDLAGHEDSS